MRSLARRALALLALGALPTAWAQCERAPTTSEVTLPGFVAAYYQNFRSDSANDLVDFYGGVCVTAVGGEWTLLADSVRVTDISGAVGLSAPNATFIYGAWRVFARRMVADQDSLRLSDAAVEGPSVAGRSEFVTLDLKTGIIDMVDLELESAAFVVRGDGAVLRGETLSVSGAIVTTCIDVERPAYQIEGLSAAVNLESRSVELTGGHLTLGSLRIPLRETLVLSEESLATFELPVKVQFISDRPLPRPGAGLGIRMVGIPVRSGVTLDIGATGIDTEHETGAVFLLNAVSEVTGAIVTATTGLEAGRPYLDFGVSKPLAPGLTLGLDIFSGAPPARDTRHEGVLSLAYTHSITLADTRPTAQRSSLSLSLGAHAAATVLAPAAAPTFPAVAGARLGGFASAALGSGRTALGTFGLTVRLDGSHYPQQAVQQWGVRLLPSWRLVRGPLSVSLSHDARFTNAASPFGVEVDRLLPRQRTDAVARVAGELWRGPDTRLRALGGTEFTVVPGRSLSGFVQLRAVHELISEPGEPAGFRSLRAGAGLTYRASPWELAASAAVETAGLIDPPSGRDAFAQFSVTASRSDWPVLNRRAEVANVPHMNVELGVNSVFGLVEETGLRSLEVRAAVPFAYSTVELRPFLAFDFAPSIADGLWPEWSAHGLDLTFITCCGSFTVGYLNDRGQWSASMSVDLERRPVR